MTDKNEYLNIEEDGQTGHKSLDNETITVEKREGQLFLDITFSGSRFDYSSYGFFDRAKAVKIRDAITQVIDNLPNERQTDEDR